MSQIGNDYFEEWVSPFIGGNASFQIDASKINEKEILVFVYSSASVEKDGARIHQIAAQLMDLFLMEGEQKQVTVVISIIQYLKLEEDPNQYESLLILFTWGSSWLAVRVVQVEAVMKQTMVDLVVEYLEVTATVVVHCEIMELELKQAAHRDQQEAAQLELLALLVKEPLVFTIMAVIQAGVAGTEVEVHNLLEWGWRLGMDFYRSKPRFLEVWRFIECI